MIEPQLLNTFSETDIQSTRPELKIGLLATVSPEGLPHVTLISSLMACGPAQMCFGQFVEGCRRSTSSPIPKPAFSS